MTPDLPHVRMHPVAPIADGICFDDRFGIPDPAQRLLMARGLVWLTEFHANGRTYGGAVIAADIVSAARIADARGLGEAVVGGCAASIAATGGPGVGEPS